MNQIIENNFTCNLMIWETNPRKRNVNSIVNIVVPEDREVSKGDVIVGSYSAEKISLYTIDDVIERRASSLFGKDYLVIDTKWSNKKVEDWSIYNIEDTTHRFKALYNLLPVE